AHILEPVAREARRDRAFMRAELADQHIARPVEAHAALEHHPEARRRRVVVEVVLAAVLPHDLHRAAHDVLAAERDEAFAGTDPPGLLVVERDWIGFRRFVPFEQVLILRLYA